MPYPTPAPKLCKCLKNVRNGSLPPELLAPIPGGFVHTCAFKSWKALLAHAKRDKIVIKPTSSVDTYRPGDIQERAFFARYEKVKADDPRLKDPKAITRKYEDAIWLLKPGNAPCSTPRNSNHGLGIAIDVANASGKIFDWMVANASTYGWYLQTGDPKKPGFESWHWQYTLGKVWTDPNETAAPAEPAPPAT
jgi:hypothetical protein